MSDYFLFFLRRVTRPVLPEPIIVMMRPAMPAVAPVATAAVVAAAAVVEVAEEVLPDDVFFVSVLELFLVSVSEDFFVSVSDDLVFVSVLAGISDVAFLTSVVGFDGFEGVAVSAVALGGLCGVTPGVPGFGVPGLGAGAGATDVVSDTVWSGVAGEVSIAEAVTAAIERMQTAHAAAMRSFFFISTFLFLF